MAAILFEHEWQFLLQMSTRVTYAETYRHTCTTFLEQIKTLIPYSSGIVFRASRQNGAAHLMSPISTENINDDTDHNTFMEGDFPHWNEYIMSPYSMVFRQSDIVDEEKWENTRLFREIWEPKGNYFGLFLSVVRKDKPLAVIGLFRDRMKKDFSERDKYILDQLKDPLERKFFSVLETRTKKQGNAVYNERVIRASGEYNLTKRESEIVALVVEGVTSEEMCNYLYITHATLSKHLSNIYAKTKVRNRTQLFGLLSKEL
ncbi:MAG: LuxR C-terminal-related transcriptional regulator [Oscillospiraceae bacterium]|jgi:DNA-binding CsgD family transcriptional regulator|nr:LuxR C-terminal-related transcriptional regulator [Oscillospiraceae bacterium]